jgi:predicted ArsR family transcriptional regulator
MATAMTNWLLRLTGDTRMEMLRLLRRSRQTITSLADALRLTDNAVRSHVAALERDGIVEHVGTQRDTGGKPARVYDLTGAGEELFPKAYA